MAFPKYAGPVSIGTRWDAPKSIDAKRWRQAVYGGGRAVRIFPERREPVAPLGARSLGESEAAMPKPKNPRSVSSPVPSGAKVGAKYHSACSELAPSIRMWRKRLRDSLESGPHTRRWRERTAAAESMLAWWESFCLGQLSEQEFFQPYPKPYMAPFLPWIGTKVTWELLTAIWTAQAERKGTPKDFLNWARFHFTSSGGRPVKVDQYRIAQQAAILRAKKRWSWMKITLKLCPQRGSDHRCSERCADRIRLAAEEFENQK